MQILIKYLPGVAIILWGTQWLKATVAAGRNAILSWGWLWVTALSLLFRPGLPWCNEGSEIPHMPIRCCSLAWGQGVLRSFAHILHQGLCLHFIAFTFIFTKTLKFLSMNTLCIFAAYMTNTLRLHCPCLCCQQGLSWAIHEGISAELCEQLWVLCWEDEFQPKYMRLLAPILMETRNGLGWKGP